MNHIQAYFTIWPYFMRWKTTSAFIYAVNLITPECCVECATIKEDKVVKANMKELRIP